MHNTPTDLARIFISGTPTSWNAFLRCLILFSQGYRNRDKRPYFAKQTGKTSANKRNVADEIYFLQPSFVQKHPKQDYRTGRKCAAFLVPEGMESSGVTLEGGDIMVVSPNHVLIGISERTSSVAAHQTVNLLFEKKLADKISVVRIPRKRDYMHIDTILRR